MSEKLPGPIVGPPTRRSNPWPTVWLILVTAGLAFIICNQLHSCHQPKTTGHAPDSLLYWQNEAGRLQASLRGAEVDYANQNQRLTDSMARDAGVRLKNLREYLIATLKTETVIKDPVDQHTEYLPPTVTPHGDTCPAEIRNLSATFVTRYDSIDVQLGEDPYLVRIGWDTVSVVWKDTTIGPLFNRKKYLQLDFSLANPDTRVTGLKAYRIPAPAPKKWTIGLQSGYGANVDRKTGTVRTGPYVGIGLTRTLLRF